MPCEHFVSADLADYAWTEPSKKGPKNTECSGLFFNVARVAAKVHPVSWLVGDRSMFSKSNCSTLGEEPNE